MPINAVMIGPSSMLTSPPAWARGDSSVPGYSGDVVTAGHV
jgi:hypothetical protein